MAINIRDLVKGGSSQPTASTGKLNIRELIEGKPAQVTPLRAPTAPSPVAETVQKATVQGTQKPSAFPSFGLETLVGTAPSVAKGVIQKKPEEAERLVRDIERASVEEPLISGILETGSPQSVTKAIEGITGKRPEITPSAARTAGEAIGTVGQFIGTSLATAPLSGAAAVKTGAQLAKGGKIAQAASKLLGTKVGTEVAKDVIPSLFVNTTTNLRKADELGLEGEERNSFLIQEGIKDALIDVAAVGGISLVGKGFKALKGLKQADEVVENIAKSVDAPVDSVKKAIDDAESLDDVIKNIDEIEVPQVKESLDIRQSVTQGAPIRTPQVGESVAKFKETVSKSDLSSVELKDALKANEALLATTSDQARGELAKDIISKNPAEALALIKQGDAFTSDVESFIGRDLYESLQKEGRFDDALEVVEALSKKFRTAGQQVQAASIWSKTTPEGMVKWAQKTLDDANIKLSADEAKIIDEQMRFINKANSDELAKKLIDQADNAVDKRLLQGLLKNESTQRLQDLNTAKLMQSVVAQVPKTIGQKVSTVQAISHLLNAKTMLRNILGNTTFNIAETASKIGAIPFDRAIALAKGNKTIGSPIASIKPFTEGFKRGKQSLQDILLDTNVLEQGKYDLFRGRTFKNPVLSSLEKALSTGLRVPDEFFKGYTKTASLLDQMQFVDDLGRDVRKLDLNELIERAPAKVLKQAEDEALYATFQDNSLPAQIFTVLKDAANKVGVGKQIRGASGVNTREFGLGDLVIKYTRVPGNLISRGIEYSPIGYLKSLYHMGLFNDLPLTAKVPVDQREAALAFGRAMTGTGLITMGTWLANKGLILSEDKNRTLDAKALDRAEGLGRYKINMSGLRRLIDGEDATPQDGDTLSSYNWNEPLGTALAIGATLNENLDEGEIKPGEITSRTVEEMLDIPTLSIVEKMFYEALSDDPNKAVRVLSVPMTEGVSGFVPGPIRQTAQFVDPTLRVTTGETPIETAKLRLQSSLPGLSKGLEPRIDPLGRPIERTTGLAETFVSPGIITEFQPTDISAKLKQIEDLTGETTQFPARKAPSNVTVNREKIELTPQEKTKYLQISGSRISEEYGKLLQRVEPESLSQGQLEQLVKALEDIKRRAREEAKITIFRERATR